MPTIRIIKNIQLDLKNIINHLFEIKLSLFKINYKKIRTK